MKGRTYTDVACISDPSNIRGQAPARHCVNLAPNIGQVANGARQGDDVDRGLDWPLQAKVQWRPHKIQDELNGVQRRAVLVNNVRRLRPRIQSLEGGPW